MQLKAEAAAARGHRAAAAKIFPLNFPFSIWGFVTLLLLMEGEVDLRTWFRCGDDPGLPLMTYQMRSSMQQFLIFCSLCSCSSWMYQPSVMRKRHIVRSAILVRFAGGTSLRLQATADGYHGLDT